MGGVSTLVAAFLTARIKDEVEIPEVMAEEGSERVVSRASRRSMSQERGMVRSESYSGLQY